MLNKEAEPPKRLELPVNKQVDKIIKREPLLPPPPSPLPPLPGLADAESATQLPGNRGPLRILPPSWKPQPPCWLGSDRLEVTGWWCVPLPHTAVSPLLYPPVGPGMANSGCSVNVQ